MSWDGNIDKARESKNGDKAKEGKDGNRSYPNGTYGQNDYTVRERKDGTYDVYIKSDSEKGHSHDRIDKYGNIIDKYHDFLLEQLSIFSKEELEYIANTSTNELVIKIANDLKNIKTLNLR